MKSRLFMVVPTSAHARSIVDHLLLKRIDINHINALCTKGQDLGDIPPATQFQRHDIRRSFFIGLGTGAILGVLTGIAVHNVLNMELSGLMIATTLIGALLGAWFSTMIGFMAPNSDLKQFEDALDKGRILLIVDLQAEQVPEIKKSVENQYPHQVESVETLTPSFP